MFRKGKTKNYANKQQQKNMHESTLHQEAFLAGADGGIVRDGVCLHTAVCHAIDELQSAHPLSSLLARADGGLYVMVSACARLSAPCHRGVAKRAAIPQPSRTR